MIQDVDLVGDRHPQRLQIERSRTASRRLAIFSSIRTLTVEEAGLGHGVHRRPRALALGFDQWQVACGVVEGLCAPALMGTPYSLANSSGVYRSGPCTVS